jgi:hypothetical protein
MVLAWVIVIALTFHSSRVPALMTAITVRIVFFHDFHISNIIL